LQNTRLYASSSSGGDKQQGSSGSGEGEQSNTGKIIAAVAVTAISAALVSSLY